ncbi:MAG TPA: NAD(P)/FAD-dependent oxidoreductase [Ignavibacteriaceae bacterium]|nr:NAD(P)/FAD-dependent oxidoreductase [Ignavibacteriaceae bacterium]
MNDVIVVGAGPAGLSAALILARARRNVLVCDSGKNRNAKAKVMHGYLTRDGINPLKFLQLAREELQQYKVAIEFAEITKINKLENKFELIDSSGRALYAKKILLATGLIDKLPEIEGIDNFYGNNVFHCSYCDGWEVRDKPLAVYGKGKEAVEFSLSLKTWSRDIILCTDGGTNLSQVNREILEKMGIRLFTQKIKNLRGEDGFLSEIIFEDGQSINRDALFFITGQRQRSALAEQLGCNFSKEGFIITDKKQKTNIKGVFAAGDAIKDMKFVIVAAGEGTKAGVAINIELQQEELKGMLKKFKVSVSREGNDEKYYP